MTTPTITVKRCTKCGETKSLDGFHRNRSKRDGLDTQCKDCHCARQRAYREAHREEILSYKRSYREAHREEQRAYHRAYREAHLEELIAYDRERHALLGDPTGVRLQEITAKYATRRGRWSEAEDAYLVASTDRVVDDALALSRTYASVERRISRLRARGVTLARDAHRR